MIEDEEDPSSPVQARKGTAAKQQNGKGAPANTGKKPKKGKKKAGGDDDDFAASSSADDDSEHHIRPVRPHDQRMLHAHALSLSQATTTLTMIWTKPWKSRRNWEAVRALP